MSESETESAAPPKPPAGPAETNPPAGVGPVQGPFEIREIMEWLPHRYPFLLIDRVLEYWPKSHLVAVKNVTMNEPFFQGHFPGLPTMPGVLMIEAMAQAAGVMAVRESGMRYQDGTILYFAGIDNVRFKRMVVPGDVLRIEARMTKWRGMLFKFAIKATVNGEVACEADMTSMARKNAAGEGIGATPPASSIGAMPAPGAGDAAGTPP